MQTQLVPDLTILEHHIQHYRPGEIIINQKRYTQPIILKELEPLKLWNITSIEALSLEDLNALTANTEDLIIIGTGQMHQHIDLSKLAQCKNPIESMQTRAACQTYTILAQEQRPVLVALIP